MLAFEIGSVGKLGRAASGEPAEACRGTDCMFSLCQSECVSFKKKNQNSDWTWEREILYNSRVNATWLVYPQRLSTQIVAGSSVRNEKIKPGMENAGVVQYLYRKLHKL